MSARKLLILTGEGIECEKESQRFFKQPAFELAVERVSVAKLLRDPAAILRTLKPGDIVFLPGGFSFADHFGSGRLLAYQLSSKDIWKQLLDQGAHLMGVCNGFQVLVAAKLFGANVKLLPNEVHGHPLGFINRWVKVAMTGAGQTHHYELSCRHGEGRLHRGDSNWPDNVKPFLHYEDEAFDNGSVDRVAGLRAVHGPSRVYGLMPHPEVSFRDIDQPDRPGPEFNEKNRSRVYLPEQNGAKLMTEILADLKTV